MFQGEQNVRHVVRTFVSAEKAWEVILDEDWRRDILPYL